MKYRLIPAVVVALLPLSVAQAAKETCHYSILVKSTIHNVPSTEVPDSRFSATGRYYVDLDWMQRNVVDPIAGAGTDEDRAREEAAEAAGICVREALGKPGKTPAACRIKHDFGESVSGHQAWGQVNDWKLENGRQEGLNTLCRAAISGGKGEMHGKLRRVDGVVIWVRKDQGGGHCNIGSGSSFEVMKGRSVDCRSNGRGTMRADTRGKDRFTGWYDATAPQIVQRIVRWCRKNVGLQNHIMRSWEIDQSNGRLRAKYACRS